MKINRGMFTDRLGRRLAAMIVLFSSCFALASTALQLSFDYQTDMNRIEESFQDINSAYVQSITLSVWSLDTSLIETQLEGLHQLPDIEHVAISDNDRVLWQVGKQQSSNTLSQSFPLIYSNPNITAQQIGNLTITASIDEVYSRLINKAGIILISNGIKTFLVSGFIMFLIWLTITRHLVTIADYMKTFSLGHPTNALTLPNKKKTDKPDEIDIMAESINNMGYRINDSYHELNTAQNKLRVLLQQRNQLLQKEQQHKTELEEQVALRTDELTQSLDNLQKTQGMLVENEKMAALGNMVAGVAHEINTPIGVCMTAASFQSEQIHLLRNSLLSGSLKRSELERSLDELEQASRLMQANINKSSNLISSFKQIAADQTFDVIQSFNLKHYIRSSINTIAPAFKHRQINFVLNIPATINLQSYPGSIHQIVSNLVNNSIIHGFELNSGGTIRISAYSEGDQLILRYFDNGRGLSQLEQQRLFEPFFTTRRGKGGSGLGMSIIHNTITRLLGGRIEILPVNQLGSCFKITIPLIAEKQTTET